MNRHVVKSLSLQQKIGQILMPRLNFEDPGALSYAKELVSRYHFGSFIIMGGEYLQVRQATQQLQDISEFPLFFGCDAERGVGQVLAGATLFPSNMSLGAVADSDLVNREARFIANEMSFCGLNVNFAPIVDVNTNPENPIINIRSYGDDPNSVSGLGISFIKGCQDEGVMACAKHFPGHGSTGIDSHIELPNVMRSLDEFFKCELIPFQKAIKHGVSSIMTAHISVPRIDVRGVPATISDEIINKLLRDLGFSGLVFTDSFHMGAIDKFGSEEEIASMALTSGCDIILDPRDPLDLLEKLIDKAGSGKISLALLDRAVERVVSAKDSWLNKSDIEKLENRTSGLDIINEIASRSVCVLKGGKLAARKAKVYILDVAQSGEDISKPFVDNLTQGGIRCDVEIILPSYKNNPFRLDINSYESIICLIYTSVGAWSDYFRLPEAYRLFLKRVSYAEGEKVVISFGSPYVVERLKNFNTIVCTFDQLDVCQIATAEVLLGLLEPQGNMPVELALKS